MPKYTEGMSVPGVGTIIKSVPDPEIPDACDLILVVRSKSEGMLGSKFLVLTWPHNWDEPNSGNWGASSYIEDALLVFGKAHSQLHARTREHKMQTDAIGTDECLKCGLNRRFIKHI